MVSRPRVSLSRAAGCSCAREAWGQGPGFSPAGLAGAAGVLDAGDRAPVIRGGGEGSRRGWVCVFGCGSPMAGLRPGRPAGCIHPFACPRHACRGAWGGYAAGRAGSITRAPALPGRRWPVPGGGQYVARPRAPPRARSRSCGLSRAADAADVPVAHAAEDQGEQLAGGSDLGGVLGLGTAAGDDAVLDLPRPRARGSPWCRIRGGGASARPSCTAAQGRGSGGCRRSRRRSPRPAPGRCPAGPEWPGIPGARPAGRR